MDAKAFFFDDVEREMKVTRTVLEALPEDRYAYRPHAKSMALGDLAMHVAFLPDWMRSTLEHDVLDVVSAPRQPKLPFDQARLLTEFDRNVEALRSVISTFDMTRLAATWTLAQGTQTIVSRPRVFAYRVWSFNHLINHRGQLCLYLRLLDLPVPTVYFNSADRPEMIFE